MKCSLCGAVFSPSLMALVDGSASDLARTRGWRLYEGPNVAGNRHLDLALCPACAPKPGARPWCPPEYAK